MPSEVIKVGFTDSGGRGSVIAEALSKKLEVEVHAFPGNDWMKYMTRGGRVETYPKIGLTDTDKIVAMCLEKGITLVDVCQDNAVERGTVDQLRANGILTVGPTQKAGQLEWSKAFGREVAAAAGVPQPGYRVFESPESGLSYVDSLPNVNHWIKADGLAEGKAALPAGSKDEAAAAIAQMKNFKGAGDRYLVEEWLRSDDGTPGEEFSAFAVCAGKDLGIIGIAEDYKRRDNFDEGPNTGSMGSSSPVTLENGVVEQVGEHIEGILAEMRKRGIDYNGILYYSGMVLNKGGRAVPHMVELNSRWGDPEVQTILPGMKNDWYETSLMIAKGQLPVEKLNHDKLTRVAVTLASRGYPGNYDAVRGRQIYGIEEAREMKGVDMYGAGVKIEVGDDGKKKFTANGGRILYVVGNGENVVEARSNAMAAMAKIEVEGGNGHHRNDIGKLEVAKFYRGR